MCGIAGHFSTQLNSIDQEAVLTALAHRGPDAQASWQGAHGLLFHSRLSIIDTDARANQPFTDPTGRYVLVFNGEIYNYQALKATLNVQWQTTSDTELLLHWLINYGATRLHELEGMFAFAFYDTHTQELLLARDRFGKKPFYLHQQKGVLSFASEVRVLMQMHPELRTVSKQQLSNWLFWQTIPGGCLIEGIEELAPGHFMLLKNSQVVETESYLAPNPYLGMNPSREKALVSIKEKVTSAIEKRLVADVPFATFLSGGVDSSIITAVAAQRLGKDLHTFTVSFDESQFSEHHIAAEVAKRYQTQHHEIRLKPQDFLDLLPEGLAATDHPSGDGLNTYVVSKYTKAEGFKMALSGIGGDEWFLGYQYFQKMAAWQQKAWMGMFKPLSPLVPFKYRKGLEISAAVSKFGGAAYAYQRLLFDQASMQSLFGLPKPNLFPPQEKQAFSQALYSEQEWKYYTQPVLLRDSDQYSMAVGLELRAPFMDGDVVNYALALSDSLKLGQRPKDLLISAFEADLPRTVYDRKKQGFTLPWEQWMKTDLKDFCGARIQHFCQRIDNQQLHKEWSAFLMGKSSLSWSRFWAVVSLEIWLSANEIIIN
jgi:asparagine synthase (glutamine-hydrolysing)